MNHLDDYYTRQLSFRLQLAQYKNGVLLARCPICLDSKKNKYKRRFVVVEKDQTTFCYCHNCGYSSKLYWFLKEYHPDLYNQYRMDLFKPSNKPKEDLNFAKGLGQYKPKPKQTTLDLLPVSANKQCLDYCISRKLPTNKLFYSANFQETVKLFNTEIDSNRIEPYHRLVIPFYDKDKNLVVMQGRALDKGIRYVTIKLHDDINKYYGLDCLDDTKPHYVLEGALDSLFLDNSIAVCDANLTRYKHPNAIYIFDNQYRNSQICNLIEKAIAGNCKVVLFDKHIIGKDINEMVLNGYNVKGVVVDSIYQGLTAKLKFSNLKKV